MSWPPARLRIHLSLLVAVVLFFTLVLNFKAISFFPHSQPSSSGKRVHQPCICSLSYTCIYIRLNSEIFLCRKFTQTRGNPLESTRTIVWSEVDKLRYMWLPLSPSLQQNRGSAWVCPPMRQPNLNSFSSFECIRSGPLWCSSVLCVKRECGNVLCSFDSGL